MKYILKKDLPFAKAGAQIFQDKTNLKYYVTNNGIFYVGESLPALEDEGWIEEVKPRELYVELFRHNLNPSDVATDREFLREDAKFKIIKVREVIE